VTFHAAEDGAEEPVYNGRCAAELPDLLSSRAPAATRLYEEGVRQPVDFVDDTAVVVIRPRRRRRSARIRACADGSPSDVVSCSRWAATRMTRPAGRSMGGRSQGAGALRCIIAATRASAESGLVLSGPSGAGPRLQSPAWGTPRLHDCPRSTLTFAVGGGVLAPGAARRPRPRVRHPGARSARGQNGASSSRETNRCCARRSRSPAARLTLGELRRRSKVEPTSRLDLAVTVESGRPQQAIRLDTS
jgi:hypothetical protein